MTKKPQTTDWLNATAGYVSDGGTGWPDGLLDAMIDDLSEMAGYEHGATSPLNLARWDLKYVLEKHGFEPPVKR